MKRSEFIKYQLTIAEFMDRHGLVWDDFDGGYFIRPNPTVFTCDTCREITISRPYSLVTPEKRRADILTDQGIHVCADCYSYILSRLPPRQFRYGLEEDVEGLIV